MDRELTSEWRLPWLEQLRAELYRDQSFDQAALAVLRVARELARARGGVLLSAGSPPCLHAASGRHADRLFALWQRSGDVATLAATARTMGLESFVLVPIVVAKDRTTVLALYHPEPGAFPRTVADGVELVAASGSIALTASYRQESLRSTISSRDAVGQAKGILMHRWKLTPDQAFEVLETSSRDLSIPLGTVVDQVIHGL